MYINWPFIRVIVGLSHNGKAKNMVVFQSIIFDVSAVPIWYWNPSAFLERYQSFAIPES